MHRAPRPLCALQKHTRGTHPNSFASVFLSRLINADIFDDVTKPLTLYFVCKSIPSIGPPITEIFLSLNHRGCSTENVEAMKMASRIIAHCKLSAPLGPRHAMIDQSAQLSHKPVIPYSNIAAVVGHQVF